VGWYHPTVSIDRTTRPPPRRARTLYGQAHANLRDRDDGDERDDRLHRRDPPRRWIVGHRAETRLRSAVLTIGCYTCVLHLQDDCTLVAAHPLWRRPLLDRRGPFCGGVRSKSMRRPQPKGSLCPKSTAGDPAEMAAGPTSRRQLPAERPSQPVTLPASTPHGNTPPTVSGRTGGQEPRGVSNPRGSRLVSRLHPSLERTAPGPSGAASYTAHSKRGLTRSNLRYYNFTNYDRKHLNRGATETLRSPASATADRTATPVQFAVENRLEPGESTSNPRPPLPLHHSPAHLIPLAHPPTQPRLHENGPPHSPSTRRPLASTDGPHGRLRPENDGLTYIYNTTLKEVHEE